MIFDKTFLKFIVVGLVNTIAGAAIIFSLYNLAGLGYWASSATSYVLVAILSFFLNKRWTFSQKSTSLFMVIAFAFVVAVSYLSAFIIAKPLAKLFLSYFSDFFNEKLSDNIALALGMCLYTGLNYLGQRFITFKKR